MLIWSADPVRSPTPGSPESKRAARQHRMIQNRADTECLHGCYNTMISICFVYCVCGGMQADTNTTVRRNVVCHHPREADLSGLADMQHAYINKSG